MNGHIDVVHYMLDCTDYSVKGLNMYLMRNYTKDVDISNMLISKGATDLSCLKDTCDYKLYCKYRKYRKYIEQTGTMYELQELQNDRTDRTISIISDYPPCVLLVGCRSSKKYCCANKIPNELFKLLSDCF